MSDPVIKIELKNHKNKTRLTLIEVWPDDATVQSSLALDNMVEWVEKELLKWKTVRRLSWDTWQFESRKEAEKFSLYFNLKWAK